MGRCIPFISVFNLTGTLKCLGSQSFFCLLSSCLMLRVPQYLSSYCASCQILSFPIPNPAFDVALLRTNNHYLFLILVPSICHRRCCMREATISYSRCNLQFHNMMIIKGPHDLEQAKETYPQLTAKKRYMS